MKQRKQIQWKRIVSITLAVVLAISGVCFGNKISKAANATYTDMEVATVGTPYYKDNSMRVDLTMTGAIPVTDALYFNMKGQVTGAGAGFVYGDVYGYSVSSNKMWLIFDAVTEKEFKSIEDGAVLSFEPCQTVSNSNASKGINITKGFEMTYQNGSWVMKENPLSFTETGDAYGNLRVNIVMSEPAKSTGVYLGAIKVNGTNSPQAYGFVDAENMNVFILVLDDVPNISSLTDGTTIEIAPGNFNNGIDQFYVTNGFKMVKQNGVWNTTVLEEGAGGEGSGSDTPDSSQASVTVAPADSHNTPSEGSKGIWFTTSPQDNLKADEGWAAKYFGSCIYVDGDLKENVPIFKILPNLYFLGLQDAQITPKQGTRVKFEGKLSDGTNEIEFLPVTLEYNGQIWGVKSSVEDESNYKEATMTVYDLYELEGLSVMTIPEQKSLYNLTNLKKESNVGLKLQVENLKGEVAFGLGKDVANNVWALSGYEVKVNGEYGVVQLWTMEGYNEIKQAEITGLDLNKTLNLEFGLVDLYSADGGTKVLARRVYIKIDGVEVLSWIDKNLDRTLGTYVPAWAQYETVVKSIDYSGYDLRDATPNIQDISELMDGVGTFTATPTREKKIGSAKNALNNAIRMKVQWDSPLQQEGDEMLISFSNNSEDGIWAGADGGYNILIVPGRIRLQHADYENSPIADAYMNVPQEDFILEIGTYDQSIYEGDEKIKDYSRVVYVKINDETVVTMSDKTLDRNLGKNLWVYTSANVKANFKSLTSDKYLIREEVQVFDLYDITKLSGKTLKTSTEQLLGQTSAATNVAVRTKLTMNEACEEIIFALSKTDSQRLWDIDASGWEIYIRPKFKNAIIYTPTGQTIGAVTLSQECIMEFGVREVRYNDGTKYGREVYLAIDGKEALTYMDKDFSRKIGTYVHTYVTPAEAEVTLESLTTKGYIPVEKNIEATDFYDVSQYASKYLNEGVNYLGELKNAKNSAIKMQVNVNKDAEEFGVVLGKTVKDKVDEDLADENVSGWSVWIKPTYNAIYIYHGYWKLATIAQCEIPENFELEVGSRDAYYENGKYYGYEVYVKIDGKTVASWIDDNVANRKLGNYVLAYVNANANARVTMSTLYPTVTLPVQYVVNGETSNKVDAIQTETKVVVGKPSKITITTKTAAEYKYTTESVLLSDKVLTALDIKDAPKGVVTYEVTAKKNDKIVLNLIRKTLTVDEPAAILDVYDIRGSESVTAPGLMAGPVGNMIQDGERQRTNSALRFKVTMPANGASVRWGMYSDQASSWGWNGFIAGIQPGRVGIYSMVYQPSNVVQTDVIKAGETYYVECGMVKCYEDGHYKYNRQYLKIGKSLADLELVVWHDSRERGGYGTTVSLIGMDLEEPYTIYSTYDVMSITDVSTQENKDKLATYTVYREEQKCVYYPETVVGYTDISKAKVPAAIKLYVKEGMKLTKLTVSGANVTNKVKRADDGAYIYELPSVTKDIKFAYTIGAE